MDITKETKTKLGWQANVRAMRDRIKCRLRIRGANNFLRQSHQKGAVRNAALRATATGLVVARVFKGNVVFARFVQSVAKEEWTGKMKRISSFFPNFRNIVTASFAARVMASKQPAQAEALTQDAMDAAYNRHTPFRDAEQVHESRVFRMLQTVTVPFLGNICYVFMHGLNRTEVYGAEKLQNAILQRPSCQGLVTVSNHVASMDDPLVLSSLLSPRILADATQLRWTLCATDRCFTNAAATAFFRSAKVLPLARGQGIYQQGIDMALGKLNSGDWVHIFPEGTRSRNGGITVANAKRGVGRLIYDAESTPLVIPFVHTGMQEIMPIGSKFPSIGKKVVVLVGDPIDMDDLVNKDTFSKVAAYDAISLRVGQNLQKLKKDLDHLVMHLEDNKQKPVGTKNADEYWQYVDWEAQGFTRSEVEDCAISMQDALSARSQNKVRGDVITKGMLNTTAREIFDNVEENLDEYILDDRYLQGSLIARLRDFANPAALVGFAAKGCFLSQSCGENNMWYRRTSWSSFSSIPVHTSWKRNVETFRVHFCKHLSSRDSAPCLS